MANVENSILTLLEHQEEAYNNVEELYKNSRYAAVIFPTGCGKSFVTLKYIEDHPDEKILFLSPRCAIKEQMYEYIVRFIGGRTESVEEIQKKFGSMENAAQSFIPGIKAMLYQTILQIGEKDSLDNYIKNMNPDLIVIDEMHHLKTKKNAIEEDEENLTQKQKENIENTENKWGEKFQMLLDKCPNAKVLGLSATPIRTDGANVVERIFKNSVASEISLLEAIEDGIIYPPKYIIPDFLMLEEKELMLKKIEMTSGPLKEQLQAEFDEAVRKSDNAPGIPELMEEHITEKNGKYIVFCKNIEDMEKKQKESQEWFGKIDKELVTYRVSSKNKDSQEQLEAFNNDKSEHLKIMYCVGMIDEGVHLNDISGVILASKTGSRPTYLQRLGRAISSGKDKKQATVIDLVNNYEILYENREINQNGITDLESLENTIIWMDRNKDGQYPKCTKDTSKKEKRHAKRLNRIKNKYTKYIENPELLPELDARKQKEISEIINIGKTINLWNTEIEIEQTEDEEEITDDGELIDDTGFFDNLEIKGAKKKFQGILRKIQNNANKHTELIKVSEDLLNLGIDLKNFDRVKKQEKNGKIKRYSTTLKDLTQKYPDINIEPILKKYNIDENYEIGKKLVALGIDINSRKSDKYLTNEEKQKVLELDIVKIKSKTLTGQQIGKAGFDATQKDIDDTKKVMSNLREENTKGENK